MSHAFTVSDEQYAAIAQRALARGQAPEDLFAEWVDELVRNPQYFDTDDWLRHLGVSEERIQAANARLDAEEGRAPAREDAREPDADA
jgi:hypothetical protein